MEKREVKVKNKSKDCGTHHQRKLWAEKEEEEEDRRCPRSLRR
jgi:hypothetical protein